jgi:hypothetical protein
MSDFHCHHHVPLESCPDLYCKLVLDKMSDERAAMKEQCARLVENCKAGHEEGGKKCRLADRIRALPSDVTSGRSKDLVFRVRREHAREAGAWIRKHPCKERKKDGAPIGGKISYVFTETSIGVIQNVQCVCGKAECLNGLEL